MSNNISIVVLAFVLSISGVICLLMQDAEIKKLKSFKCKIIGSTQALELSGRWRIQFSGGAVTHVDGENNTVLIPEGQSFSIFQE